MDLTAWAQGGILYEQLRRYPVSEIFLLQRQFAKINAMMKAQAAGK